MLLCPACRHIIFPNIPPIQLCLLAEEICFPELYQSSFSYQYFNISIHRLSSFLFLKIEKFDQNNAEFKFVLYFGLALLDNSVDVVLNNVVPW